ncbi:MAG: chromophore lyase CpcT/CpeT [Cyanobacteriota bacterium]|nr:chromophore lyase CpcT/CpeT [Cyanobacteriota bacterium]
MATPLLRLLTLLSGGFSNQQQAFDNPPLYAHILVKFRPLPQLAPGSLLLDQSYAINPAAPYRLRVLKLEQSDTGLLIHNHAIHDEQRFWGAIDDADRRSQISPADLRLLEGCSYVVRQEGEGFVGEVEPGCRCLVERKGSTAYLVSTFRIEGLQMRTLDRGHDPITHEHLWGSLAGEFEFERSDDFSGEIPDSWRQALAG